MYFWYSLCDKGDFVDEKEIILSVLAIEMLQNRERMAKMNTVHLNILH